MKSALRSAAALPLLVSGLAAQVAAPSAPPDASETVLLPSFTVSENAASGYRAANSVSATRTNTPISDLPFAVSAFTSQFIADTGSRNLMDVARYSAGVSDGSSEFLAGDTTFSIRGFKQTPEHDGFFETAQGNIYVDMANVDRVEVVKGPASLLYGQIQPGGTVNYITKRPQPQASAAIDLQVGSFTSERAAIDLNQPLIGTTLLFRFNGAWENNAEYAQPSKTRTRVIDPSLTWNVTPRLTLKGNFQWFYRRETPPALYYVQTEVSTPAAVVNGLSAALGYPAPAAALSGKTGIDVAQGFGSDGSDPGAQAYYPALPARFNYSADSDVRWSDLETTDLEADYTLADNLISRFDFNYNSNRSFQELTGIGNVYVAPPDSLVYSGGVWSVAPSWNALSAPQQLAAELAFAQQLQQNIDTVFQTQNGTPPPAVNPRRSRYSENWGNNTDLQWEFAGDYRFSWGRLKPLAGLFYDKVYSSNWSYQNSGTAAGPYFRAWDLDPASPTYYMNQNTPAFSPSTLNVFATSSIAFTSDQAAYGVLNLDLLDDRLILIGGARYNRSQSQTTNYLATANAVGRGYKAHDTTPQLGVGYKVVPGVMLYASYSQSYSLPAQTFLRSIQTVNGVLQSVPVSQAVPTTGEGYEVGVKTDLLEGRISSTFSVYDTQQNNVVQSINQIIGGNTLGSDVQQTQVTSKGAEYEITWTPLANWQVFASVSEDDIRNTKEPAGYLYYLGAHPFDSAKTLANLWTRYSFDRGPLKGAWIGGGFNYSSRILGVSTNVSFYLPSYCIYNGAVGYSWTEDKVHLSLVLNADNIGNQRYYQATQVRSLPGRARLSFTARY